MTTKWIAMVIGWDLKRNTLPKPACFFNILGSYSTIVQLSVDARIICLALTVNLNSVRNKR